MVISANILTSNLVRNPNPEGPTMTKEKELGQKHKGWEKNNRNELDLPGLAAAVEQVNEILAIRKTRLEFSVHEPTKDIIVKVVDEQSGDLIREVPPERVLNIVAMIWEQIGLLVDEKA